MGPAWTPLVYLYFFGRVAIVNHILLVASETLLLRILMDKVWKRMVPLNDEFFGTYLPFLNLLLGTWFAWQQLTTKEMGVVIYR